MKLAKIMKEVIEIFESIDTGILYRRYRKRVDRTNFRTEIKSGLDIAEKLRRINNKAGKEFLFEASGLYSRIIMNTTPDEDLKARINRAFDLYDLGYLRR